MSDKSKKTLKGFRISQEAVLKIAEFAKYLGTGEGESLEYLIAIAHRYRLWEPSWKKYVIDDVVLNAELRAKYAKELTVFKAEIQAEIEKQMKALNWKWELLKM